MRALFAALIFFSAVGCVPTDAPDVDEILKNIDQYYGKRITVKARSRSGARCRQGEDGEWKTYCKDCQYCRGPIVIDSPMTPKDADVEDWPMILGGTWEGQDIRCKGPLNEVECYPFKSGKQYIVQGRLEKQHPPKLLVAKFWEIEDQSSSK